MNIINDIRLYTSKMIIFFKVDIWRIRLAAISKHKAFFIRVLRIFLLISQGLKDSQFQLRATSLTFYSFLSIVPMLAMAFGISKGFGFEKILEKRILEIFTGQEEVLSRVIGMSRTLLENTKGGAIAGVGVVILLWTAIKVLSNIENSFNQVWRIKKSRTIGRKFSDYLSIMLICPLLFIMSGSITVFITTQITKITEKISLLEIVSPVIFLSLKLLPFCLIWILFSMIYIIMPNTRVKFLSGFIAGVIAGSGYQLIQGGYISFQINVASYNAIYGSFAALPLFLIWLHLSWYILLLGAEISFALQNVNYQEFIPDIHQLSFYGKKICAIRVARLVVNNFYLGKKPLTAIAISQQLKIPLSITNLSLDYLIESSILFPTINVENSEPMFLPAKDIHQLSIFDIIEALEQLGSKFPVQSSTDDDEDAVNEILEQFKNTIKRSQSNKLIMNI